MTWRHRAARPPFGPALPPGIAGAGAHERGAHGDADDATSRDHAVAFLPLNGVPSVDGPSETHHLITAEKDARGNWDGFRQSKR